MIHEVIVTTMSKSGEVHIAPMGIRFLEKKVVISPFRPSQTLDNILESNIATVNFVDDVRVFAGIVSRYKMDWELSKHNELDVVPNLIIANTVYNLIVSDFEDDEKRPNARQRPHLLRQLLRDGGVLVVDVSFWLRDSNCCKWGELRTREGRD